MFVLASYIYHIFCNRSFGSPCIYIYIIIRVFCPRAGHSLQTQAPRLQFCPKADLLPQTQEPGCNFTRDRCGSFPLLSAPHSLFSIWTDLKRSVKFPGAPTWRWGEWIWLTGPFGLHRHSPQGLNIGSIRVFDQISDPEISINFRPHIGLYIITSVLPKGRSFTANSGTRAAILPKGRSSIANSGT